MSTVKILELPYITEIQSNTANTVLVGVDVPSDTTGQITLTTIAGKLYSNNNLKVGNNDIIYANAVGQFTGNSVEYLQVTVRNQESEGSGDFVVTADDGTDGSNYIDMGLNGSEYNDPEYSAMGAHDGYIYVQTENGASLVLGTTASDGRINFIIGGTEDTDIVSYISSSGVFSPAIDSLVAANVATLRSEINSNVTSNVATLRGEITANAAHANSVINTRITANVITLRDEITANVSSNAAYANSVINTRITANVATLRGEITANAVSTNAFANLAFTKANNALANTSSTHTAGDFYVSGDGFVNGTFILANSNFGATESAMTIRATETVQTPSQSGTMLHVTGKSNVPNRIIFDSFSTDGSAYTVVAGRTARGTVSSPTASQNNDVLMRIAGNGWGTTGFAPLGVARIDIIATENYTDTARGSKIVFYNIPEGSNVVNRIAEFNANTVTFTGAVRPEKGFIHTPNVLSTLTTLDLNFQRDNLIKFNVINNATITLSNYIAGKVIEVWITNNGGQNKTITHGCLATNSSVKNTDFTILDGACAYLRYFSIGEDQANTFVSIVA